MRIEAVVLPLLLLELGASFTFASNTVEPLAAHGGKPADVDAPGAPGADAASLLIDVAVEAVRTALTPELVADVAAELAAGPRADAAALRAELEDERARCRRD